jgi:16S rRNA (cytosine1402-N4)-methyltransferase
MEQPLHTAVMADEALAWLDVQPGKTYVDATAGAGGHLSRIVQALGGTALPIGVDRDSESLARLGDKFAGGGGASTSEKGGGFKPYLVHANYAEIRSVLAGLGLSTVSGGILADLGVSSMQLDNPGRGFSFVDDGPLDMRMDPTAHITAEQLINKLSEKELADVIYRYGEERLSRPIARAIADARPLHTTLQLANVVSRVVRHYQRGHRSKDTSHPATRTFQAIRIAVNDELKNLEAFLREAIDVLETGARLVVITFHSLEDRMVKQILREASSACICPPRQPICTCDKKAVMKILTPKPVAPSEKEVLANPRSRSAKLRVGEKVG